MNDSHVFGIFFVILPPENKHYIMQKEEFQSYLEKYADQIEHFRQLAHDLHQSVNQAYAGMFPYGFHLDMVVEGVRNYGYLVCACEADNDVLRLARNEMTEEQALLATEIVYALTNDKGRTRAERAGEKYYQGIRETPYAPFVKLCDRLANITYSCTGEGNKGTRMREVYKGEMPHFLPAINPHSDDPRLAVPVEVVEALAEILIEEVDKDEIRRQWGEF